MNLQITKQLSAPADAIKHHYDVGNDFYSLWLDPTMTYTCAIWDEANRSESLEAAQLRKIDFHAAQAKIQGRQRVLDIGCGWGGALKRFIEAHGVEHAVGLTLSQSQLEWMTLENQPNIQIILESWADHTPTEPYDGIISVEAFEAFAKLGLSPQEKLYVYRQFFERCHQWLNPEGYLSLQTIAYGNTGPEDFDDFIANDIFPESDLPRLAEIAEALEYIFEIVSLRNDRHDYIRTLKTWRSQLRKNYALAVELVGEKKVKHFDRYLRLSTYMFESGNCALYRIALRRIDNPRRGKQILLNT